jgi:phosphatidylserine/phosphatidylglycerophosphate/cardiolipin synthase-like enzyme
MLLAMQARQGDRLLAHYFVMRDCQQGKAFAQALWQAAERGAEVSLILDSYGSFRPPAYGTEYQEPPLAQAIFNRLIKSGVQVYEYHPIHSTNFFNPKNIVNWQNYSRRTHNKNFLFDLKALGAQGVIVGDTQWASEHFNNTFVGNNVMVFDADVYENALDYSDHLINTKHVVKKTIQGSEIFEATVLSRIADPYLLNRPLMKSNKLKFVYNDIEFAKDSWRHGVHDYEYSLIKEARKRLIYCTPYFAPERQLKDWFIKKVAKGVDVKILMGKHHEGEFIRHGARFALEYLARQGIRPYLYNGEGNLHYKDLISDKTIFVKTANGDGRSRFYNLETGLIIQSEEFLQYSTERIERDLKVSQKIECHKSLFRDISGPAHMWKDILLPFYYRHL